MKAMISLPGCLPPSILVFKNVEDTSFKQKINENHDLKNKNKPLSFKDTLWFWSHILHHMGCEDGGGDGEWSELRQPNSSV